MGLTSVTDDSGLAPSLGDLVFRVHGGPADGEIVRFGERKSTIGSDAACTYCISDDQIHSVQCLILRGSGGSLVRRWADGTLLNGEPFLDSRLKAGDRLGIGAIEMEVIEDNALTASSVEVPPHAEEPSPPDLEAQPSDRLRLMEESWQETFDGLRAEIASLQEERQTWHDQRRHWESELAGHRDALSNLARQLDEFQQVRQREQDAWLEELQQLKTLIETAVSASHEPQVEDASLQAEKTAEPPDCGTHELPQQGVDEARFDRFFRDETETAESQNDLKREQESQWLEDRDAFLQQPDTASDTSDASDALLDDSADRMPAEDHCAPDVSCVTQDSDQTEESDADEESASSQSPSWVAQYEDPQDETDSSITDYMNRLLQRVGGNDQASAFGDERGTEAARPASEDAASSESDAQPAASEMESEDGACSAQPETSPAPDDDGNREFTPRNSAPERDSNMAAMRELANNSARSAIQTCDKNRTAKGALGRIPLLLVELGCGGLLLYWAMRSDQALAYAGTAVCLIAAAMTGVHTLWLFFRTVLAALTMPEFRETPEAAHADGAS